MRSKERLPTWSTAMVEPTALAAAAMAGSKLASSARKTSARNRKLPEFQR